jgi:hypothetical protein
MVNPGMENGLIEAHLPSFGHVGPILRRAALRGGAGDGNGLREHLTESCAGPGPNGNNCQ